MRALALSVVFVASLLSAPDSLAVIREANLFVEEDAFCGQTPPEGKPAKIVAKRGRLMAPEQLMSPERRAQDGFISGRLHVDPDGKVTSVDVYQEIPAHRGLKDMLEEGMAAARYIPGLVGTVCITIAVDIHPTLRKGEWVDVDYPVAPKASQTEPFAYPPDAFASGISGLVGLLIEITPAGRVKNAIVREEEPVGQLFGAAALEGVRTWHFDGATPGRYRLKVRFKPDAPNAPPTK